MYLNYINKDIANLGIRINIFIPIIGYILCHCYLSIHFPTILSMSLFPM